jgi:Cu2+-exporting ATPase
MMIKDYRRRFIVSTILTIPILLLDPIIQGLLGYTIIIPGQRYILFLMASIVYFYGGLPFLKGFVNELRKKTPGMMVLIAVAISTAYLYSVLILTGLPGKPFFWELATLIDIMLLGHWIEMKSILGASRALEEMVKLLPSEAHLLREDGTTVDVPIEKLVPGDKVLIKPGEKIPVDGIIIEGRTSVNESMLTGESKPVSKDVGDEVIAGSINGEGSIIVEVRKTGAETYLSQVIELVRQAQETRSKTQDLANRAAYFLTIIAIIGGSLTFLIWLFSQTDIAFALERAVTVMVITCPHALGLAVPLVVAVSTALAARNGFLIRQRDAFERARELDVVVFDKTGTLTKGEFGVTDIIVLGDSEEKDILRLAASLESKSEHPIAQGIVSKAVEMGIKLDYVDDFKAIPGRGVEGIVNGRRIMVVSPGYLRENRLVSYLEKIREVEEQGKTVVFVLEDSKPIGAIALGDLVREESKEAVKALKEMGLKVVMLTGDNKSVARWVSEELGLDEFYAEVLPHEKVEVVKKLQRRGYKVAMVGDGINDAPALIQADVGIAIGAGTDVAIESADIILVRNDPRDVVHIISLARKTYKKMMQNLFWATGYNAVAIPLAAGILYNQGIVLSPAAAAVLMSLSTVIVAINARLLKL